MAMKRKNLPELVPQVFDHEQFGKIRVVTIDGKPFFVGKDVCRVLDIKNVRQNLANFPDDEKADVCITYTSSNGVTQKRNVSVVSEPGLYRLIFMSRKPEAEKFKRWVFHEILPSIRETGSYSVPKKKKKELPPLPPGLLNDDPTDFDNLARLELFLEKHGVEYDFEFAPKVIQDKNGKPSLSYCFELVIKDD